jgi:D-2-hydroxyacid dehydrogenase (NADP+)
MAPPKFPPRDKTNVLFAHAAYRMSDRLVRRFADISHIEVRTLDDLRARAAWADVIVVSGLWRNELLEAAPKLRFVQSISAGTDQYNRELFRQKGVRLASAAGVNAAAVAEHALALMLSFTRRLNLLRDAQTAMSWRPMLSDLALREEELGGKTLLVVGLGRIGDRVAALGKAFGMKVIATRRDEAGGRGAADAVFKFDRLKGLLPEADFVVLTCPLTPQTERLIDGSALASMKRTAYLINVARGKVVDEPSLISALRGGLIAGAGLDCAWEEPLPATSPLWTLPNTIVTPHSAGETQAYEDNVIDILMENLGRLWKGETALRNEVV